MYIHTDERLRTQPERETLLPPLLWGGGIAVHKLQRHTPLPPPRNTYKTFLIAFTKMKLTYATLLAKLMLETLSKVSFKASFLPHVLQTTKPSRYNSHGEAVVETLKPVKVIQMNYSVFQGVMNLRQDILQSWLLNATISAYA